MNLSPHLYTSYEKKIVGYTEFFSLGGDNWIQNSYSEAGLGNTLRQSIPLAIRSNWSSPGHSEAQLTVKSEWSQEGGSGSVNSRIHLEMNSHLWWETTIALKIQEDSFTDRVLCPIRMSAIMALHNLPPFIALNNFCLCLRMSMKMKTNCLSWKSNSDRRF